jgi:hypothetical protein
METRASENGKTRINNSRETKNQFELNILVR